jgi:hypothetical protein
MDRKIIFAMRRFLILAVAVIGFASSGIAQTESARVQGNVTDTAGAAIPGATVTVRSTNTGREVKATTNEDGFYSILSLQPGTYDIEVTQSNFRTTKQQVKFDVAQNATLDFSLEAGAVSETVTVTGDAPQVETGSSTVSAVVRGRQITELPLNGRNVVELARLSPGVTQGVPGGFATGAGGNAETYRGGNTGGAALSVNGQRTQANNYLLDGVDNNESLVNTINVIPSADAVQEFRVQTSVSTAEFGRGGGAILNTVTRSGTRAIHGSAYLFLRNSALDARPAFFNSELEHRRTPLFRRSQFGGTIGGPVWIPGFGEGTPIVNKLKNKVFFFFSYDGIRQFLPRATELATVPTPAFRNGDFSALSFVLRDPLTNLNVCVTGVNGCVNGNGTPYNRLDLLPGNRLNPAALAYLRAYPLPNNGTGLQNNFQVTRNEIDHQNVFDFRIDANINTANQVFARGNYAKYDQTVTSRLPSLPAGFGSGTNPTRTKGLVVGWNWVISPTIFNEFRAQGNKIKYGYEPPFGDVALSQSLGIVNANRDASLGGGALIGGFNSQLEYTGDFGPYRVPQETLQVVDSLGWVHGNHTFKFGGSILHRNVQLFRPLAGKGDFRMYGNGNFHDCPNSGGGAPSEDQSGTTRYEQADLLIGFMCTYDIGFQQGSVGTTNWENGFFGQDDWKVTQRLTLNLGLRYEYFTNPAEQYARQANFDLTTGHLFLAQNSSDTLTETDKNNFGPRVGFAYDIRGNGRSVIRGGYGMFYFLDRGGIGNQLAQNPPFAGSLRFTYPQGYRITFTGQGPLGNNNNTLATLPLPLPLPNTDPAFLNNPLNANVIAALPDNKVSNVQQFNVQFQYQLTNSTAVSAGYVGTRGRNLILYYNLNGTAYSLGTSFPCPIAGRARGNCYPGIGAVTVRDDNGKSQYDSLQIQAERRLSRGWQYIAAYTFSKTKDNGEGAFDSSTTGNYVEEFTTSKLDFPHVFSFESIYEIPFGRNRSYYSDMPRALDYVIGGWQINGIFRAQSGSPFDVRAGGNRELVNLTGDPYSGEDNPFLNVAAFSAPPAGTLGNLERNSLRGPSNWQLNMGLMKNFYFTETTKLEFRAEAFNVTNRLQWGSVQNDIFNSDFGKITTIAPFSNRQLQFGLRLEF